MISITRRYLLAVTLACSSVLMASASYADKIKVAAIYTLPVEQQWISRIHKALNTAASRGDIEYIYSENIANTDYERVMREYAEQGMQLIVGEVPEFRYLFMLELVHSIQFQAHCRMLITLSLQL